MKSFHIFYEVNATHLCNTLNHKGHKMKIMNLKELFGKELKERISRKENVDNIGSWSHAFYYEHVSKVDFDLDFGEFLLQLGTMEMGPEFERSYEELDQIADKLIAGENVQL